MADGPTGPDFGAMLALNRFSQQGGGGGSPVIIAAVLPGGGKDIDVGRGASLKTGHGDSTFKATAQSRPGMLASLIKSMGLDGQSIMDGMKKVGDAGAVRQINSITEIQGQAATGGGSGSFVDNLGPRGGSDFSIG